MNTDRIGAYGILKDFGRMGLVSLTLSWLCACTLPPVIRLARLPAAAADDGDDAAPLGHHAFSRITD